MTAMLLLLLLGFTGGATGWRVKIGEVHGRPTFSADGSVVFVAAGGSAAVVALDARDGRVWWNLSLPCHPTDPVWQKDIKCGAVGSPALSRDGSSLFVGGQDRALWRVASARPTVQWRYALGGPAAGITGGVALSDDGAVVFVVSGENKNTTDHRFGQEVHAVDAISGLGLWAVRRCGSGSVGPCAPNTSPTFHRGLVLVGDGQDGYLYALNATTGETVWRFRGPLVPKGTDGSCKSAVCEYISNRKQSQAIARYRTISVRDRVCFQTTQQPSPTDGSSSGLLQNPSFLNANFILMMQNSSF